MSGSATTFRTARFLTADYLVRGEDNAIACPLWASGALVAPTQSGSTVTVYDPSNVAVVSAAAVTVTGSIATYTIPAASLPSTRSFGMGWRVEWSLIVNGTATVYKNNAGLVRSRLAPMITDADLFRREGTLDPSGASPISSLGNFQAFIDEAWITLIGRLVAKGSLPHLIMEPAALREPLLMLTLHLVFEDFRTRLNETWGQKATDYAGKWEKAWAGLSFEYDSGSSGQADSRKRQARPSVWLM